MNRLKIFLIIVLSCFVIVQFVESITNPGFKNGNIRATRAEFDSLYLDGRALPDTGLYGQVIKLDPTTGRWTAQNDSTGAAAMDSTDVADGALSVSDIANGSNGFLSKSAFDDSCAVYGISISGGESRVAPDTLIYVKTLRAPDPGFNGFLKFVAGIADTNAWVTETDCNFPNDGLLVMPSDGNLESRTLTGTTAEISIANGNGASGNPTFGLPDSVYIPKLSVLEYRVPDYTSVADSSFAGITTYLTAGYTTQIGDCVYLNDDDGRLELTDKDAETTTGDCGVFIILESGVADGSLVKVLVEGWMRYDSKYAFDVCDAVWIGDDGLPTTAQSTTTGDFLRIIGHASPDADIFYFKPEYTWLEIP